MTSISISSLASQAYDVLACDYDAFTDGYAYDRWFQSVHSRVRRISPLGRRALDVACGTGTSTAQLIAAGYEVAAFDVSSGMVQVAKERHPDHADAFFVADMRDTPEIDPVDFALCMDDSLNYLAGTDDLHAAFSSIARVIVPGGVFAFDVNTLASYRSTFAQTFIRRTADRTFLWEGKTDPMIQAGGSADAQLEVFGSEPDSRWSRRVSRHQQRHFPEATVREALVVAGFDVAEVIGQLPGARFEEFVDEERHIKLVYLARRR